MVMSTVGFAISPNEQVKIFANKCFEDERSFINNTLVDCNYTTESEAERACLGEPINNYFIDIEDYDSTKSIEAQAKTMAFYVFPILIDNKPVTDMTVVLDKGEWILVDVGGNVSKVLYEKAEQNGLRTHDLEILRYGGQTFIYTQKNDKEIAWSPHQQIAPQKIKYHMIERQNKFLNMKNSRQKGIIGGESFGSNPPLSFHQNLNLLSRLNKAVEYYLGNI